MRNYLSLLCLIVFTATIALADSPYVGAFSRMGYGARGMGMGNALVAVNSGDISTYYNPALASFSAKKTAAATVGILSLDRSLNFLNYTQPIHPAGGFSLGLINAGVSKIDGRNSDGVHTEDYSTSENQFYLAFANRMTENLSLGVAVKMYYSKLFEEVSSSTVGFDIGGVYQVIPGLTIGASLQDINSKYNWNTSDVYGTDAKNPKDKFPLVKKIGAAYDWIEQGLIVSFEYESTSASTQIIRMGAEYTLMENISVRGGFDRWELGNDNAAGTKPSFGFTARRSFGDWTPAVTYAFIFEPFSSHDIHVITLSTTF